jgi:hypothetical protein
MKGILVYIANRLKEASTWRGILALLTSLGIVISPELQEAILAAGLAIIGLIGIVFKDKLGQPELPWLQDKQQ